MTQLADPQAPAAQALAGPAWSRFARAQAGGLPRAFWALWSGTLVNRIGYLVEPFLAYYLTGHRGLSVTSAGTVIAASGLGSVLSQLVAGAATDRIGRRATLTLGMVANAASLIALGYASGFATIIAVTFLFGVTVDIYRPASQALVADLVGPADRARAYGLLFWAVNLGFSVAMVLGGVLARIGFQWLFWADAVTCVTFGVLVWRLVPASVAGPDRTAGRREGFGAVLRDAVMAGYLCCTLAYTFVYLQAYTTLPLAMKLRGLTPGDYGLAIALNGLLIVAIQPVASGWLARRDHVGTLAAGVAITGIGFGLTSIASSTPGYALSVAVWTLGEIITAGMAGAIVADLAPAHLRGRYSGVVGAAWGAGYLLAPLGGTRLLVHGAPVLWLTCSALCAVTVAGLLALRPAIMGRALAAHVSS